MSNEYSDNVYSDDEPICTYCRSRSEDGAMTFSDAYSNLIDIANDFVNNHLTLDEMRKVATADNDAISAALNKWIAHWTPDYDIDGNVKLFGVSISHRVLIDILLVVCVRKVDSF